MIPRGLPTPPPGSILIVDAWAGQGQLDVPALVRAGAAAIIAKCTDGLHLDNPPKALDAEWLRTSQACLATDTPLAPYCVIEPNTDPVAQVQRALEYLQSLYGTCGARLGPVFCDFELAARETGAAALHAARVWTDTMTSALGRPCGLYTMPAFRDELVKLAGGISGPAANDIAALGALPLWLAEYGVAAPRVPRPWSRAAFWQRSGGRVASPHDYATLPWPNAHGAEVDVDVSVLEGTVEDFLALGLEAA
jgi:GH25 family lysozyme M1 (1,4-beta-N-acetylmuramidase)